MAPTQEVKKRKDTLSEGPEVHNKKARKAKGAAAGRQTPSQDKYSSHWALLHMTGLFRQSPVDRHRLCYVQEKDRRHTAPCTGAQEVTSNHSGTSATPWLAMALHERSLPETKSCRRLQSVVSKWESLRRHDLERNARAELVTAILQEVM